MCYDVDGHRFQQFFMQLNKIKYHLNINQEVTSVPVELLGLSLLKHWPWPRKAVPHVPLKCGLIRSHFHCINTEIHVYYSFKNIGISS
jgi:hypothetical protein